MKITDYELRKMIEEGILDFMRPDTPEKKAQKELERLKKLMGKESGKDTDLVWKNHLRDKLNIAGTWRDYLSTQRGLARDPDALNKFKEKLFEVVEEELQKLGGK
tara:strand:- start:261 stop:575 length:315 start_codon:yes stop_codon:yes gene_type:complete